METTLGVTGLRVHVPNTWALGKSTYRKGFGKVYEY